MRRALELEGKTFGRLVVKSLNRLTPRGNLWNCTCSCGAEIELVTGALTCGHNKSCGCLKRDMVAEKNHKHGFATRADSGLYHAFLNAKNRCGNPADQRYADYGGRGIKFLFCSFQELFDEIGSRPTPEYSLDRIDNAGNYEAGNVKWSTRKEQQANTRRQR